MLIGYDRPFDGATYTQTGGSSVTDPDNAGNGRPRLPWAFTGATTYTLKVTTPQVRQWRVAGIIATTLPVGTLIRFRPTAGETLAEARVTERADGIKVAWIAWPEDQTATDTPQVSVIDDVFGSPGLSSGATYQIGEFWVSPAYAPPDGWLDQFESGFVDPSEAGEAQDASTLYEFPGLPYREALLEPLPMTPEQARDYAAVRSQVTRGRRCVVMPYPNDETGRQFDTLFGRSHTQGAISARPNVRRAGSLGFRELV